MVYEMLSFQKEDHVLIINLLGGTKELKIVRLTAELSDLCNAVTLDKEIKAVIITWMWEAASSRADLGEDISKRGKSGTKNCPLAASVAQLDVPVIMDINGDVIDQILELALACDLRIVSEKSRFGLLYINRDMIPWDGGTQRLPRLVGKGKAIEMILTGETINAEEAYRIGLINQVLPEEELMTAVKEMAHKMASKGPIALRYAKEAIQKGMDLTLDQGLRLEADLYFLLHTTRDRTEGIRAFKEKRHPQFEGR